MKLLAHKLLTVLIVTIYLFGCQEVENKENQSSNIIEDWKWVEHPLPQVVLTSKDIYEYQKGATNQQNYWDIPPKVVSEIYEDLPDHIKNNKYTFEQYGLQYIGNIDQNGKKTVTVLGFCMLPQKMAQQLHYRPYVVLGGGKCFFKAMYDPALKSFTKVNFNASK